MTVSDTATRLTLRRQTICFFRDPRYKASMLRPLRVHFYPRSPRLRPPPLPGLRAPTPARPHAPAEPRPSPAACALARGCLPVPRHPPSLSGPKPPRESPRSQSQRDERVETRVVRSRPVWCLISELTEICGTHPTHSASVFRAQLTPYSALSSIRPTVSSETPLHV